MSKPRLLADILKDYFQNSSEPLAVEFRKHFAGAEHPLLTEKPSDEKSCQRVQNSNSFEVLPSAAYFAQSETPLEDWVDAQDVMQALHISPRTLQTLRSNGTLPYSRIGNKIYYRRQDIIKILSDNYTMYKIKNHDK
ncbi:MAG: helix-turn-helix domain-containing protein [Prevotellaceae bacterium]|jgi:hypothetical protein|nr:helix-turn-helix domain-containing protein [Prevotellaceae bacterium]